MLTILYLPANFTASLMGSKTFGYNPETANFGQASVVFTGNFWLAGAITLALAALTAFVWAAAEYRRLWNVVSGGAVKIWSGAVRAVRGRRFRPVRRSRL